MGRADLTERCRVNWSKIASVIALFLLVISSLNDPKCGVASHPIPPPPHLDLFLVSWHLWTLCILYPSSVDTFVGLTLYDIVCCTNDFRLGFNACNLLR